MSTAAFTVSGPAAAALPIVAVCVHTHTHVEYTPGAELSIKKSDGASLSAFDAIVAAGGAIPEEVKGLLTTALSSGGLSTEGAAFLRSEAPTLRALLNIGVRHSRYQTTAYTRLHGDTGAQEVHAALAARLAARTFLVGERISVADVAIATALWDLLTLVYPASIPGDANVQTVQRWFATVVAHASVNEAATRVGLLTGGVVRVGGQVDLRPMPARVAALADAAIAKNAHEHKHGSQRDAEKAAKSGTAPAAEPAATAPRSAAGGVAATATQPEANKSLPGLTADERIEITSAKLGAMGIAFNLIRHAPANTVDDLLAAIGSLPGLKAKNLFIKAKKEKGPGDSRMWLVVAAHDTRVDLVDLAKRLGYGKIVLRFGDAESLVENLGVVQGHVSPICLMNDTALQVNVAVDAKLLAPGAGPVYFHPLVNEASIAMSTEDLAKFISGTGHSFTTIDFATPA